MWLCFNGWMTWRWHADNECSDWTLHLVSRIAQRNVGCQIRPILNLHRWIGPWIDKSRWICFHVSPRAFKHSSFLSVASESPPYDHYLRSMLGHWISFLLLKFQKSEGTRIISYLWPIPNSEFRTPNSFQVPRDPLLLRFAIRRFYLCSSLIIFRTPQSLNGPSQNTRVRSSHSLLAL